VGLLTSTIYSGAPGWKEAYIVGTSDYGTNTDIQVLAYAYLGQCTSTPSDPPDPEEGWQQHFGGSGDDVGTSILRRQNEVTNAVLAGGYGDGAQSVNFIGARLDPVDGSIDDTYSYDFGGDDYCLDMTLTSDLGGQFPHSYVWLVGRSDGASQHAAVAVFDIGTGSLAGVDYFQYLSGGDAAFNAVTTRENGLVDAWAAGRARSSVSDTDTLVIRYAVDLGAPSDPPALVRTWIFRAPPGTETGYDEASCLTYDGGKQDIFCGGVTTPDSYGLDFLTMRISE
jgi:hypothetical protein